MSGHVQWDWIARSADYEPKLIKRESELHGVVFPYTHWENGPQGWPCKSESGGTASPGSDWWTCNACGQEIARVARGGCGDSIHHQEANKSAAFEFHYRNCQLLAMERAQ